MQSLVSPQKIPKWDRPTANPEQAKLKSIASSVVILAIVGLGASVLAKEPAKLIGTVKNFECGDNCYLTILTREGVEVSGLCVAKECMPWNKEVAILRKLLGRKVL